MLDLSAYGFTPDLLPADAQGLPARVTAVHRDRYELACQHGQVYGRLKAAQYFAGDESYPTAGDFVLLDYNPSGDSRITRTLPRRTCFTRLDPSSSGHGEQAVAANFDVVFIMQSLNGNFNTKRLERYLTLAWQSGATPVVALTKLDLAPDAAGMLEAARQTAIGADVLAVSAVTGEGLDRMAAYLRPRVTAVFLGSSGVGKSSLVNALAGETVMATGEIREDDDRGRHTTTYRQLMRLPSGAMIIDTPGMRELGMWDVTEGADLSFADVERYAGACRFADCRHGDEPGCAVRAAIRRGELDESRLERYLALKKEAMYADDKAAYLRQKQAWHKSIAKATREMSKR